MSKTRKSRKSRRSRKGGWPQSGPTVEQEAAEIINHLDNEEEIKKILINSKNLEKLKIKLFNTLGVNEYHNTKLPFLFEMTEAVLKNKEYLRKNKEYERWNSMIPF